MSLANIQKRIKQPGQVSTQQQRGHASFIRLKCRGNNITHQSHVLTQIFRQTIVRTLHQFHRLPTTRGILVGFGFVFPSPLDALFNLANAGQILVQFRLIGRTDLTTDVTCMLTNTIQNALHASTAMVVE